MMHILVLTSENSERKRIQLKYIGKRKSGCYYVHNFSLKQSTFYIDRVKRYPGILNAVVPDYVKMLESGRFRLKFRLPREIETKNK